MSYLTDYYKKQCVLLEERLQYLSSEINTLKYNLSEADYSSAMDAMINMPAEEFEAKIKGHPQEGMGRSARMDGRARMGLPPDPPRGRPTPSPDIPKSAEGKPASYAQRAKEAIKNADFSPKNIAKNVGNLAVGLPVFMGTEYAVNKGLESVGVKNKHARGVPAAVVGGAVADVVTPIVLGGGIPTLGAASKLAGKGGLYGLAAYGGLELADIINNIEINSRTGKKVEDWTGEALYDYVPPVKMATNLIAGSSPFAGLGGKGTATGVPGGERARVLKNAREDPTFKVDTRGKIK
jgi:hypothetical protein